MAIELTAMPASFAAGTTVKYTASHPDYPASAGWVLKVYLRRAGVGSVNVTASADGDDFDVVIPATTTDELSAEVWGWFHQYTKAGEVFIGASGTVLVTPWIATSGAQSHIERVLVALRARLEGRITADAETLQVDNQAISRIPFDQLPKWISFYEDRLAAEQRGGGTRVDLVGWSRHR